MLDPSQGARRRSDLTPERRRDLSDINRLKLVLIAAVTKLVVLVSSPTKDLIIDGKCAQVV